jgi:hypothetical protein
MYPGEAKRLVWVNSMTGDMLVCQEAAVPRWASPDLSNAGPDEVFVVGYPEGLKGAGEEEKRKKGRKEE